jgi:hypothetical protein
MGNFRQIKYWLLHLSNIAMNTEAFPRTRNRPMPVTRFRRLFADLAPLLGACLHTLEDHDLSFDRHLHRFHRIAPLRYCVFNQRM